MRQLSGAIAGADADKTERLRVDAQNQSLREQVSLRGDESDYSGPDPPCSRVRARAPTHARECAARRRMRLRLRGPASA